MGLSTGELIKRYADNHELGLETLRHGAIPPFAGLKLDMQSVLILAARFDVDDRLEAFLGELSRLEGQGKFEFALATRDFPLHCTLGQARLSSGDSWAVMNRLRDIFGQAPNRIMSLRFNRVRFSGTPAEVLLLGDELDPQMDVTRAAFDALTALYGRQQLMSPPIQHCSITRHLAVDASASARQVLIDVVEEWDQRLRREPLVLTLSHHFVGTVLGLLSENGMRVAA